MPEDKKESKGDQPPFDPTKLLGQLKDIVGKNKDTAKGGGKSWIGTLIILAVVLAGVAVFSWISWRRGRELAKLRHEKNKAKILKQKAVVDAAVSKYDQVIVEALKELKKSQEDLQVIEADIRAEEKRHEADLRAIDSIRSWRDAGVR